MTKREKAIAQAYTLAQQIFESTVNGVCGRTSYYVERNGDISEDFHIGPYERESVYRSLPGHAIFLADIGADGNACGLPAYEIYEMGYPCDPQPCRQGKFFGAYDRNTDSYWGGHCWMTLTDKIQQWHDVCDEDPAEILVTAISAIEMGFFDDETRG